ncbi:MAG: hypothetical protein LBL87_00050 [Ruminococcus sp.]|nr:hypothetical protein [Ruminococcus sp.]
MQTTQYRFEDDGVTPQKQFKYGYAKGQLSALITIERKNRKQFSYERAPTKGNKYHGNLLLSFSLEKKEKLKIRKDIAAICILE